MSLTILQYFAIIKFISIIIPTSLIPTSFSVNFCYSLNILEAVVVDLFYNNFVNYANAVYGLMVMCLLYRVRDVKQFKLWSIVYSLWNMIFIFTKGYSVFVAIANNLPALYYTLVNASPNLDDVQRHWTLCRCSAIITQLITLNCNLTR
jgi:hypothetical protein